MQTKPILMNLSKKLPNVLFLGNGLSYQKEYSWNKVIENVSRDKKNVTYLQDENGIFKVPNTLLTFALCNIYDTERKKAYLDALNGYSYPENNFIKELINFPFDAILTTNYTYDIENAANPKYISYSDESKRKQSFYTESDKKYLIHTYNRIETNVPIWHIHGEIRRKSSIIMAHPIFFLLTIVSWYEIYSYHRSNINQKVICYAIHKHLR